MYGGFHFIYCDSFEFLLREYLKILLRFMHIVCDLWLISVFLTFPFFFDKKKCEYKLNESQKNFLSTFRINFFFMSHELNANVNEKNVGVCFGIIKFAKPVLFIANVYFGYCKRFQKIPKDLTK